MKNEAGETDGAAEKPPQPLRKDIASGSTSKITAFRLTCICVTIETENMCATLYSTGKRTGFRAGSTVLLGLVTLVATAASAAENRFARLIEETYQTTKQRFQDSPNTGENAWRHARACFEWGEFARSNTDRAALAEEGMAAAKTLIARDSKDAAGYYYLGMNLGQLARTRTLTALGIVDQMREQFEQARKLDEHVDYAGPDRYLGMLYRDAPGWPASIGNRKKARQHLERAVELRPDYPENQLALLESLAEWGEKDAFRKHFGPAALATAEARKKLTGPYWEYRWADWDKTWHELRAYKARLDGVRTSAEPALQLAEQVN